MPPRTRAMKRVAEETKEYLRDKRQGRTATSTHDNNKAPGPSTSATAVAQAPVKRKTRSVVSGNSGGGPLYPSSSGGSAPSSPQVPHNRKKPRRRKKAPRLTHHKRGRGSTTGLINNSNQVGHPGIQPSNNPNSPELEQLPPLTAVLQQKCGLILDGINRKFQSGWNQRTD